MHDVVEPGISHRAPEKKKVPCTFLLGPGIVNDLSCNRWCPWWDALFSWMIVSDLSCMFDIPASPGFHNVVELLHAL